MSCGRHQNSHVQPKKVIKKYGAMWGQPPAQINISCISFGRCPRNSTLIVWHQSSCHGVGHAVFYLNTLRVLPTRLTHQQKIKNERFVFLHMNIYNHFRKCFGNILFVNGSNFKYLNMPFSSKSVIAFCDTFSLTINGCSHIKVSFIKVLSTLVISIWKHVLIQCIWMKD